jgi:hypothetical protein
MALPNASALIFQPSLLIQAPLAVILSGIIAAFVLVQSKIPTSLIVVNSLPESTTILVPTVLLDSMTKDLGASSWGIDTFIGASQVWTRAVQRSMETGIAPTWPIPSRCEAVCTYEVIYMATGLTCEDIDPNYISNVTDGKVNPRAYLRADGGAPTLYNATSNFASYTNNGPSVTGRISFTLAYRPFSPNPTGGINVNDPVAATCYFTNTTYHASTSFKNNTQTTTLTAEWVNSALDASAFDYTDRNRDAQNHHGPYNVGDPPTNYLAIADAFVQMLSGVIQYIDDGRFSVDKTRVGLTSLFVINELNQQWSFSASNLIRPSLARGLESLIANATLSIMELGTGSVSVEGRVVPGYNVWEYKRWLLWLLYGIAILLTIAGGIIGLVCLQRNGAPSSTGLMQYIATTRGPTLDRLFHSYGAGSHVVPAEVQEAKLRYGEIDAPLGKKQLGFIVVTTAEELSP